MVTRIRRTPQKQPRFMRWIFVAIVAFTVVRSGSRIWANYLWFDSVGYTDVWKVEFVAGVQLAVVAGVIAAIVLFVNVRLAGRFGSVISTEELDDEGEAFRSNAWLLSGVRRTATIVTLAFVVFNALGALIYRQEYLWFMNREPFGVVDPQLGVDVGFYLFTLPLLTALVAWFFQLVVLALILAAAVHYLNGGIELAPGKPPTIGRAAKAHVSILVAVLALLRGVRYLLARYDLLLDQGAGETVFGAGATDVDIRLNGYFLLAGVAVVVAAMLIVSARRSSWQLGLIGGGLWLATAVIVSGVVPLVYQRLSVEPDEQVREQEYVERQLQSTREAYGLAGVEVRSFAGAGVLTSADIEANRATVDNVRLWDPAVLKASYSQLQAIRTYYRFTDVDVDRYEIDGELRQVMLSARELDSEERSSEGWVTERLVFTHGYGAVVSAGNEVNGGNPGYLVEDIPPVSSAAEVAVEGDANQIYFGEGHDPSSFLLVNTDQPEVDFPLGGEGNSFQETNYAGAGGIPIGGTLRQLMFALNYGDYNVLISKAVTEDSKILVRRNVADRVAQVAPYLALDSDPYLVVADGRLIWMLDLYSVSDNYPYSSPATVGRLPVNNGSALPNRFNYVRNSVKATVDATDGTINLYVVDDTDPIIKVQQKIFNTAFLHLSDMPESLQDHVRYPEDLFRVQSDMYTTFHVTDPEVFFLEEDKWEIPADPSEFPGDISASASEIVRESRRLNTNRLMVPYYVLMALPNEDELSYLLLQPFNPKDRPNLASFLVAQSDPDRYGRLIDYRLPRNAAVAGPSQVKARIDADAEISAQLTLWGQRGSTVIRGNLLVIPIEESLLYVQPLYLESDSAQPIPELKRVVLVYGEDIVMGDDLQEAIGKLFDVNLTSPTDGGPDLSDITVEDLELLGLIQTLLEEAQAALDSGDLGLYQAKIDEVSQLVRDSLASSS